MAVKIMTSRGTWPRSPCADPWREAEPWQLNTERLAAGDELTRPRLTEPPRAGPKLQTQNGTPNNPKNRLITSRNVSFSPANGRHLYKLSPSSCAPTKSAPRLPQAKQGCTRLAKAGNYFSRSSLDPKAPALPAAPLPLGVLARCRLGLKSQRLHGERCSRKFPVSLSLRPSVQNSRPGEQKEPKLNTSPPEFIPETYTLLKQLPHSPSAGRSIAAWGFCRARLGKSF